MINELMEVSMPYSIFDLKRLNTKELYHKLIENMVMKIILRIQL